jgi:phosphatidate phosphatase PAH1
VEITVNGEPVHIPMKVSEAGEAYFVTELEVRTRGIRNFIVMDI